MKKISMLGILLCGISISFAQPKVVEKAIVKVKTEMTFPENFGNGGGPGGGGGGGGEMVTMSMPRDMETNTTMYYTPSFMKVESMSDFGNNVVITDRINKKTTTLIEAMGRKTGFFSTDADMEAMKAKTDSMRQLKKDSLQAMGLTFKDNKPELVYSDETKKISGVMCKKVTIKSKGQGGAVTENVIWYNPEFKMAATSTAAGNTGGFGGGRGGMMSMTGIQGLELIEGFPMEYEMVRGNGFKIHMTVLKVQPDANIDEKIFEIPKGFDLKPMSSMQGGSGEGMRMIFRRGGEN
jgi:hypothetical protein